MEGATDVETRRPMGAAGLAGGMAAAGAGAVLLGAWATADPRVIGFAEAAGLTSAAVSAGLFTVVLGGLMLAAAWGLWGLRAWGWWAALALAIAALALTFGSVPWMLGLAVLIVYLADVRGAYDGPSRAGGSQAL